MRPFKIFIFIFYCLTFYWPLKFVEADLDAGHQIDHFGGALCGGSIVFNETYELDYQIPTPGKLNETGPGQDSGTCVWVIWSSWGNAIGFHLTHLDLTPTSNSSSPTLGGVLSIQKELQLQENFTTPRLINSQDLGHEIIVNESWTLLVFRHFTSQSQVEGKGFKLELRGVQTNRDNKNVRVRADFLGGQFVNKTLSQFVFPQYYGQPCVAVVKSLHGLGIQVSAWTFMMEPHEFANFYKFSKQLNQFVFVKTLVYMYGSSEFYGTLEGEEDEPILFYMHVNSTLTPKVTDKGMFHISYSYKNLTNMTSDLFIPKMNVAVVPTGMKEIVNGSMGAVKIIKGSSWRKSTFICIGATLVLVVGLVALGYFCVCNNWTGRARNWTLKRNIFTDSVNYTRQTDQLENQRRGKISVVDEDEPHFT